MMALFGLSEPHYNLVKQQARLCNEKIKDKIATGSKYDHCAAEIIIAHHTPVQVLVNYTQFCYMCGFLEGRFGGGRFDYE